MPKLFVFDRASGARHFGVQPFGVCPGVEFSPANEADLVWYQSVGDGQDVALDMRRCREFGKPCVFVLGGDCCYVPDRYDSDYYFAVNARVRDGCWCVPNGWDHLVREYQNGVRFADSGRDILCSFRGALWTHSCRAALPSLSSSDIVIEDSGVNWFASDVPGKSAMVERANELMRRSKFALCPRGNGPSSIRVNEAVFRGAIPVFIEDWTRPFGLALNFALRFPSDRIDEIPDRLRAISAEELEWRRNVMREYRDKFLLGDFNLGCTGTCGCADWILRKVSECQRNIT